MLSGSILIDSMSGFSTSLALGMNLNLSSVWRWTKFTLSCVGVTSSFASLTSATWVCFPMLTGMSEMFTR